MRPHVFHFAGPNIPFEVPALGSESAPQVRAFAAVLPCPRPQASLHQDYPNKLAPEAFRNTKTRPPAYGLSTATQPAPHTLDSDLQCTRPGISPRLYQSVCLR